jgi:hypothetical protein
MALAAIARAFSFGLAQPKKESLMAKRRRHSAVKAVHVKKARGRKSHSRKGHSKKSAIKA